MFDLRPILRRLEQIERAIAFLRGRVNNLPARWAAGGGASAPSDAWVRIDSDRGKGEVYKAFVQKRTGSSFNVDSGTFAASDLFSDGAEISLINFQQGDSKTTHVLTAGARVIKVVRAAPLGLKDNNGTPLYAVVAKDFKACR
jgi:hypothetical protein